MSLCSVCGNKVGAYFAKDTFNDLIYCETHSHLSGSSQVIECVRCGQRVAAAYFIGDICPNCGANFIEEVEARKDKELETVLTLLKNIGPRHFIFRDLLSCIFAGSIIFLVIHYGGILITPIGAAAVFTIVIIPPLVYEAATFGLKTNFFANLAILGRLIDIFAFENFYRIEKFVGKQAFVAYDRHDVPSTKLMGRFELSFSSVRIRISDASTLARLLMLILVTLFVELFWPGYLYNLLLTAAIAVPSSIIDAVLFQRIPYPYLESELSRV